MRRKTKELKRSHINKELLLNILRAGAVIPVALVAPGALKLFKTDGLNNAPWEDYYPSSVERAVLKLWRKGQVEIYESATETTVRITNKGKQEVLHYNFEQLEIVKPSSWDKKWRMVIFDIPNSDKKKRDILRKKLNDLGFYLIQESVFVYPYPCEREIKFLREVLEIPHNVKLMEVSKIENEGELRKLFRLK